MKPSDLYRELAEQEANRLHGGQITPEKRRHRHEEAETLLRKRAADIIERLRLFKGNDFVRPPVISESEHTVQISSAEVVRKVIKKVVSFTIDAPDEIVDLIDPNKENEINIDIIIGSHDLVDSNDFGKTWGEPIRCASLDILTQVGRETTRDDFSDYDVVLQRMEQLNPMHPVLQRNIYHIDPPVRANEYFFPPDQMHQIESMHGALDLAEDFLEP